MTPRNILRRIVCRRNWLRRILPGRLVRAICWRKVVVTYDHT